MWHIPLAAVMTSPVADIPYLSEDERRRATGYRQVADQIRFAVARSSLRRLLADRLHCDPCELRFAVSSRGKPYLRENERISFNVSHSGEHVLIATSSLPMIGVDIESLDHAPDWHDLIELVCTQDECRHLAKSPLSGQHKQFLKYWTAKEALLKALGTGIAGGLQALSLHIGVDDTALPDVQVHKPELDAARTMVGCLLDDVDGCIGCLAYLPGPSAWM